jgi:hypothetical protein
MNAHPNGNGSSNEILLALDVARSSSTTSKNRGDRLLLEQMTFHPD